MHLCCAISQMHDIITPITCHFQQVDLVLWSYALGKIRLVAEKVPHHVVHHLWVSRDSHLEQDDSVVENKSKCSAEV